ncbi:MAG: hypothetical protein SFW36_14905 [Leptolyngbyaceae cyanobacterium bins.59]|nr:hypothetical protein [Leptolyngbyaceae cyanobacterium bins.59]
MHPIVSIAPLQSATDLRNREVVWASPRLPIRFIRFPSVATFSELRWKNQD